MSRIACVTVGRSAAAAITVLHKTVSRLHAEVIPLPDGRVYITDCASSNGTFVCDDGTDGQWRQISQDFAGAGAQVRFGEVEMTVPHLLTEIARIQGAAGVGAANGPSAGHAVAQPAEQLDASLGVARNPETGEPIALADKPE